MKNELEARIEHLRRCSLTEELANKPDDFGWWVVANYGEALLFQNDKTMLKEGREYVSQLASLCAWDYDGAYSHVSENFLMYLQARADRIGQEEKESDIGQFISYMTANRDYTSKLQEALDDHFGMHPDEITDSEVNAAKRVYSNLSSINEVLKAYGYGLEERLNVDQRTLGLSKQ